MGFLRGWLLCCRSDDNMVDESPFGKTLVERSADALSYDKPVQDPFHAPSILSSLSFRQTEWASVSNKSLCLEQRLFDINEEGHS